ncbi:nickel/cobalt transporter [Spirochaeta dissipatitropha]
MNKLTIFAAGTILLLFTISAAGANPFAGGDSSNGSRPGIASDRDASSSTSNTAVSGLRRLVTFFPARIQRNFNNQLADLLDAEDGGRSGTLLLTAVIAFLYGLVHAALPGHRKTLLVSYFLASKSKPRHAVMAGIATAVLHAGAGGALVLGAWFVLQVSVSSAVENASLIIQRITAGAAIAIGMILLGSKLLETFRNRSAHDHSEDDANCSCGGDKPPGKLANWLSRGKMLPAIVLSATVPCPGSSMILLFALAVGNLAIGLLAVGMFATGMGLTLVSICLIAVLGKNSLAKKLNSPVGHFLHEGLEIVAAAAIIFFGIIWLTGGPAVY